MIRLLLLVPLCFLPFQASRAARARARARIALGLIRLASRLDVTVVVLAAQSITLAAEATLADALLKEFESGQKKSWPSTLN